MGMQPGHYIFQHGHVGKKTNHLECAGDSQRADFMGCFARNFPVPEKNTAHRRRKHPAYDLEKGGFSGTIGTDNGLNAPIFDRKAHLTEGHEPGESFGKVFYVQDGHLPLLASSHLKFLLPQIVSEDG